MTDAPPSPAPNAAPTTDLRVWQSVIGRFASSTFGHTPPDVHATRLINESVDVLDRAVTGRDVGAALGGVLVVVLAMAEQAGTDVVEALAAEHALNRVSQWRRSEFGQWNRIGAGDVPRGLAPGFVGEAVAVGALTPRKAAAILIALGASPAAARDWLTVRHLADASDFEQAPASEHADARAVRMSRPQFRLRRPHWTAQTVKVDRPATDFDLFGFDLSAWTTK